MPRFRWVLGALVFGLAGALVGVVPDGVSAVAGRGGCRATAFVTGAPLSTIDVKTRTKDPTDIAVVGAGVAVTPDGKTTFVAQDTGGGTVATIDVKTKAKHPDDIAVGPGPTEVAITPDGKTALSPTAAPQ
jgi:DNA-binding beta-propeller fold protein YncE